jgi:glycosyltransferase involved in cell wall biosynthesis
MPNLNWSVISLCILGVIICIQLFYYIYFFVRLAYYKEVPKKQSQQHPVSVVICARNEAENLANNLPGVLVQKYASTHEVIVVNDNSVDESKYLLASFQKTFKQLAVVTLTQEAKLIPGKKYPLSVGIKTAKHEVVLLTDADCVPASEDWIYKMQHAYNEDTEIVLGYSPYKKYKGWLNAIIRFETFHTALQYLSYTLAKLPYMGVGRNLSYKKDIFFRHKGFSSINHVTSGDDDLFISLAATKNNTRIIIDPDTFTLSEPKRTWRSWRLQKSRHYSTAKYYKPIHKLLLMVYNGSHFLFYPLLAWSLVICNWQLVSIFILIKYSIQGWVYYKTMQKLQAIDLWKWFIVLDIWTFFYYLLFAPTLWKKPRRQWT